MDDLAPVYAEHDSQTRRKKIHCKQELIVSSLQRFYNERQDLEEILKILQGTSDISLRLIDWFVTNYAKDHTTSYTLNNQEFLVYMNYKSQLKAYSKKLFDPFCRRERILFQVGPYPSFLTTVGKLNFFRWALEKGVLDYIYAHQAEIEKEMNTFMREIQKEKTSQTSSSTSTTTTTSSKSSTRRRLVSKETPASKLMQKHEMAIEVRFD
jgi:hypothetical protein